MFKWAMNSLSVLSFFVSSHLTHTLPWAKFFFWKKNEYAGFFNEFFCILIAKKRSKRMKLEIKIFNSKNGKKRREVTRVNLTNSWFKSCIPFNYTPTRCMWLFLYKKLNLSFSKNENKGYTWDWNKK